jgi:type I restriction enzyme S subunit
MIIRIGDIISISSGGTPKRDNPLYYQNGTIPWVKTGDLKGKYSNYPSEFITEDALKNSSAKIFPKGTVLLAMYGATIGECSILNFDAATNQACAALLPNEKVDENYLYYFLSSYKTEFIKLGVGGAQPNISAGIIKNIQIPLPPLSEQKRIADLLDAADSLRQKDKTLLKKYDQLTQSLFLEMFGDPVKNEKGWEKVELNQLVSKLGDGLHGTPNYDDNGEYYFVNGNNLVEGKIIISPSTKKVNHSEFLKHQKDLNESTILVSINGTIGKTALYNQERIILGKSACYFNIKEEKVNKIYILSLVASEYFLKYAIDASTGSTIKNVSLKTMREFPVLLPPISLQNQFAEQAQLIEKQKKLAKKNLEKSEELFKGLMWEVFK